ncbi:hypothetical protein PMKS-000392 [Pichia membranifaciens]|uniref:Uncharacterized protein n=1 Tax=Pichia membranifaciens TaxID=4926 RepID=A0A1Q2YBQ0_9ASCO|nr:hypothetical protein PMKS-000392 [Pichia membranifaciens]
MQTYKSMIIEKPDNIDWNRLAYVFYATGPAKLFPLLVNVRQLRKINTKAKIHVICSFDVDQEIEDKEENLKLVKIVKLLRHTYSAELEKFEVIKSKFDSDSTYWSDCFTKLHSFSLTQYDRIIYLDSDSIIRKRMDQLFFLPPALLAAPLNYVEHPEWQPPVVMASATDMNKDDLPPVPLEYTIPIKDTYTTLIGIEANFGPDFFWSLYSTLPSIESALDLFPALNLGSYVMVIMPDKTAYEWIYKKVEEKKMEEYDMEIINSVWKMSDLVDHNQYTRTLDPSRTATGIGGEEEEGEVPVQNEWLRVSSVPSLLLIPHAPYALLSGEFRKPLSEHNAYLITPPDFGYLTGSVPMLSIQRALKNGISYKNIDDVVDLYPEVPYWDWAWRFDFEGNALPVKELMSDIDIDMLMQANKNTETEELAKRDFDDIDYDDVMTTGMGVDKFGWDGKKIAENAMYIHWSDWPLGKPWEFEGESYEQIVNSKDQQGPNSLFTKMADEAVFKCTEEASTLFSSINTEEYSKASQLLQKERKFAARVCEESVEAWKDIYREYWSIVKDVIEDIHSV